MSNETLLAFIKTQQQKKIPDEDIKNKLKGLGYLE